MALTDEGGSMNYSMPVAPAYGNGGGFGFGGDWAWILLLLVLGGGWGGFGGFGMGGAMMGAGMMGGMWGMDYLYPWLNNSQNINDGFRDQQLATQVGGIQNSITSGFGDVQLGIAGVNQNICSTGAGITSAINQGFASTNLGMCQGFNGVNNAISGAQNALAQQLYSNQISDLERSFAAQTANTAGLTNVSNQLSSCCCENRLQTVETRNAVATEGAATRAAIQNQTQAILDKLCQQEIDNLKAQNISLQNQVNMQNLAASQAAQTAALVADNTAQTQYIVNRVAPYPQPAIVYGYNQNWVNPLPTTSSGTATA